MLLTPLGFLFEGGGGGKGGRGGSAVEQGGKGKGGTEARKGTDLDNRSDENLLTSNQNGRIEGGANCDHCKGLYCKGLNDPLFGAEPRRTHERLGANCWTTQITQGADAKSDRARGHTCK